jgi:hypothetical protein
LANGAGHGQQPIETKVDRPDGRLCTGGDLSMKRSMWMIAAALLLDSGMAHAQALNAPVTAHPNPESLFTSRDPKLNRNKQVALKIVRDLLEAGHWELAPQYLTKAYIQHNPLAASGPRCGHPLFHRYRQGAAQADPGEDADQGSSRSRPRAIM